MHTTDAGYSVPHGAPDFPVVTIIHGRIFQRGSADIHLQALFSLHISKDKSYLPLRLDLLAGGQSRMSNDKALEELPSSQHYEGDMNPDKHQDWIIVPEKRQSAIRKKVSTFSRDIADTRFITSFQFDRRVLPIVCILYILSYLDRGTQR